MISHNNSFFDVKNRVFSNPLSAIFNFSLFMNTFFKSIQSFCRGVSLHRFLRNCSCSFVLIIFSSRHVLETHRLMYRESNSTFFVKCQFFQITPSRCTLLSRKLTRFIARTMLQKKHRFLDIYLCAFKIENCLREVCLIQRSTILANSLKKSVKKCAFLVKLQELQATTLSKMNSFTSMF